MSYGRSFVNLLNKTVWPRDIESAYVKGIRVCQTRDRGPHVRLMFCRLRGCGQVANPPIDSHGYNGIETAGKSTQLNTAGEDGPHFCKRHFHTFFPSEKYCIVFVISLNIAFCPQSSTDMKSALVQVIASHRIVDTPSPAYISIKISDAIMTLLSHNASTNY